MENIDLIEQLENNTNRPELNIIENLESQIGGVNADNIEESIMYYKETLEFIENYNGKFYEDYLREFENFFKEQHTQKTYKFIISDGELKKQKNNKDSYVIKLPEYKNVNDIIKQINLQIDETRYKLKKTKKLLLHKSNDSNLINNFNKYQANFIKLVHLEQIFSSYHYKINNKDTINEKLNSLFQERRNKKQILQDIYNKIKDINNTTKNYLEIKKLSEDYIKYDNIKEIDKKIRELISLPSIDNIVMQLPVINKKEPYKVKELLPKKTDNENEVKKKKPKKKLKIKEMKPTEEPKKSSIETGIIDVNGKKRRQIKGKKVEEATCVFPFKEKKKYVNEEDGCIKSKDGDWCATSVDKDDYSYDKIGFCKK